VAGKKDKMIIPLFDVKWKKLNGGYKTPYDPSNAIINLGNEKTLYSAWEELWHELHHQGEVGEASYAAVPHIVNSAMKMKVRDWNVYSLISIIEIESHKKSNPKIPDFIGKEYYESIDLLANVAIKDLEKESDLLTIQSILGFLALKKGHLKLGALITTLDSSEINEIVENYFPWNDYNE
jgi:hypothetical protein